MTVPVQGHVICAQTVRVSVHHSDGVKYLIIKEEAAAQMLLVNELSHDVCVGQGMDDGDYTIYIILRLIISAAITLYFRDLDYNKKLFGKNGLYFRNWSLHTKFEQQLFLKWHFLTR